MRPEIERLGGSLIRAVAEANIGRGDVIPLWFGEPDTATPDFIKEAAVRALAADHVFYTQNRGIPPLREAIAAYASGLHGRDIGTDRITVTASGMNAIMLCSQLIVAPGDNIVAVGPIWPNCVETVHVMGGETRIVPLEADGGTGWRLDLDRLLDACDDRTVGVLVNSPANPTGWVMTADDQRALLESCRERGIYVIADEVYIRLAYNAPRAPSFLDIAEPDDRLLAINSFSKSWSMTGWRLGWLTHAPDWATPSPSSTSTTSPRRRPSSSTPASPRSGRASRSSNRCSNATGATATSWCSASARCGACGCRARTARSTPSSRWTAYPTASRSRTS